MVEIIGFVTIVGLVWLLGWTMAGESDAERRRVASSASVSPSSQHIEKAMPFKRAA